MKISPQFFGLIIIGITVLVTFHWVYAHLLKDMLVPELAVAIFLFYGLGILLLSGKLKIK